MRINVVALVFAIVSIAALAYGASICNDPAGGPAQLCLDNDQLICAQGNPTSIALPNATRTASACETVTVATTDVGTTTPSASAIPVAGTDSKISTGWIDTGTDTTQVIVGSDPRLTDPRTPLQTYSHTVTVSAGKIKPLSAFKHAVCWGTVAIGVTVVFTNIGAAGVRQFLLLSTYGAAGNSWRKMVSLETGYGQAGWAAQHNIYVRDSFEYGCGTEFGLSAEGSEARTASVIFTDYTWGLGIREDTSYKAEEDVSNAGDFYSRVKLAVNYVGIGVSEPTIPLDIASSTFAAIKLTSLSSTNGAYINIVNNGGQFWVGRNDSTGTWLMNDGSPYSGAIVSGDGHPIELAVSAALKLSVGDSLVESKVALKAPNQVVGSGGITFGSGTATASSTSILTTGTLQINGAASGSLYAGDGIGFTSTSTATDTTTITTTSTVTDTVTGTTTGSALISNTGTGTGTGVATFSGTATGTMTTGSTGTSTQIRTLTITNTSTGTLTGTVITDTVTSTLTGTGTGSATSGATGTVSGTMTNTYTGTGTGTDTGSATYTFTSTFVKTATVSATGTITVTVTHTNTESVTVTGTSSTTMLGTTTGTGTGTGTGTALGTSTETATGTTTTTDTETSATIVSEPRITNLWHLGYVTYWLKQSDSDISTYKILNTTVASIAAEPVCDYVSISSASGETLIAAWITESGNPGAKVIPAGDWIFNAYPFDSCPASGYYDYLKFKVYRRAYVGTETELFSVETAGHVPCYGEDPIHLLATTYTASKIVLQASERIVVKVYARTTNATALNVGLCYDSQYGYTHGDDSGFNGIFPGAFTCIETPMTRGFTSPNHRDYDRVLHGDGSWKWIEPFVP